MAKTNSRSPRAETPSLSPDTGGTHTGAPRPPRIACRAAFDWMVEHRSQAWALATSIEHDLAARCEADAEDAPVRAWRLAQTLVGLLEGVDIENDIARFLMLDSTQH